MKTQVVNGYFVCGNDYVATAIHLICEADSHVFTCGNQPAYDQAVKRAGVGPPPERRPYISGGSSGAGEARGDRVASI